MESALTGVYLGHLMLLLSRDPGLSSVGKFTDIDLY